jgi:two-component system phosphate regulon sensor histidine kinase PhoR
MPFSDAPLSRLRAALAAAFDPVSAPPPPAAAGAAPFDLAAYAAALEAHPDPLVLIAADDSGPDPVRRILFANEAARAFLRIPREGALLVTAVRRPEVLEAVDVALIGAAPADVAFETGGAQDRFWRVWTRPLPTGDHRRLALMVMRDETDARRNERMRADFLANASHELRTPLASLAGFVETLRGHARDDAGARDRFLAIMSEQASRMGRLIDDLLSLSRIELNEHIPPSGVCDLAFAVSEVAETLGPLAREKKVDLDLVLPGPDEAAIVADRDQIVQVAQNLLANALKYAPAGGRVTVEVVADAGLEAAQAPDPASPRRAGEGGGRLPLLSPDRSDGERYAVLTVTDTGPGMRREHLPRLSERFYRVEGQKSGERLGTGLGLAIVKHIVNRHRGGLIVEAAPGLGAQFRAYFPSARTGEAAARPGAPLVAEIKLS